MSNLGWCCHFDFPVARADHDRLIVQARWIRIVVVHQGHLLNERVLRASDVAGRGLRLLRSPVNGPIKRVDKEVALVPTLCAKQPSLWCILVEPLASHALDDGVSHLRINVVHVARQRHGHRCLAADPGRHVSFAVIVANRRTMSTRALG